MSHLRQAMVFLITRRPIEIVAGTVALAAAAVILSAAASTAIGRRRQAWAAAKRELALALALLSFCLCDWALLRALPRLRLSFSPQILPPLVSSLAVRLLIFWGFLGATLLARWRSQSADQSLRAGPAVTLFLVANLLFCAVQVDAYIVEPLMVETTQVELSNSELDPAAPPLRVVHLTDLHIERSSFREETVVQKVNQLAPDLILLTGDYLNLSYLSDPVSADHFRRFVSRLEVPYGIYAVRGSVEPTQHSMAQLVEGTEIVWLEQDTAAVNVRGQEITLLGVACSHDPSLDLQRLRQTAAEIPASSFTVLLYHSPDLIAEAAQMNVDLYLGGHTHGGQLRLPLLGPFVTGSRYGRRYAAGYFEEGGTTMIISRGLGFEGGGMPRARFLCRPEIISVDLTGAGNGSP